MEEVLLPLIAVFFFLARIAISRFFDYRELTLIANSSKSAREHLVDALREQTKSRLSFGGRTAEPMDEREVGHPCRVAGVEQV